MSSLPRRRIIAAACLAIAIPIVSASCSDPDSKSKTGQACSDKEAKAKYTSCKSAKSADSCTEAGGTWKEAPEKSQSCGPGNKPCMMAQNLPPVCDCGTAPDSGCACTSSSDCAETCLGKGSDRETCEASTEGTCGSRSKIGCACQFGPDGKPSHVCI